MRHHSCFLLSTVAQHCDIVSVSYVFIKPRYGFPAMIERLTVRQLGISVFVMLVTTTRQL